LYSPAIPEISETGYLFWRLDKTRGNHSFAYESGIMQSTNTLQRMRDEQALVTLMENVIKAFNEMDIDKLLSLHTETVILMEPGMPIIQGKEKIRKLFHKLFRKEMVMQLFYAIHEVECSGSLGFVRGQVIKTITAEKSSESETGKFICICQKQSDGRWLRTHVIVNGDADVNWTAKMN
jgi:uncharacterized protein (TIGR02246 family)